MVAGTVELLTLGAVLLLVIGVLVVVVALGVVALLAVVVEEDVVALEAVVVGVEGDEVDWHSRLASVASVLAP